MATSSAAAPGGPVAARRRRVFFALWPADALRQELVRATRAAVRQCGGRATPRANLHVTLAFLGPLTPEGLAKVMALAPPPGAPFSIVLDCLGLWEHAQVLWLGPKKIPEPLIRLEAALWDALVALGFERERRAYRPHMTIARKAQAARGTVTPVAWRVDGIALVDSRPGPRSARYEVLNTWPFAG